MICFWDTKENDLVCPLGARSLIKHEVCVSSVFHKLGNFRYMLLKRLRWDQLHYIISITTAFLCCVYRRAKSEVVELIMEELVLLELLIFSPLEVILNQWHCCGWQKPADGPKWHPAGPAQFAPQYTLNVSIVLFHLFYKYAGQVRYCSP